jgi:glycosyltransferase involved in cell wall biosynthesis
VTPRISIVVRSFNRLPSLCELAEALLAQRHDSFEIVVVEQSTVRPPDADARLAVLARDPRLRVHRFEPLGGARARNRGVSLARGEVIVFIDDDDLPIGDDFLSRIEQPFLEDPLCLGVTCRHERRAHDPISPPYRLLGRLFCMRFSWLLRLPHNFPRLDRRVDHVDYVHGTGGAYRRCVFERFGGWDEDTPIEDETSLGIRIGRGLAPGEHLVFDPRARLRRRNDIPGGLGKRAQTPARFFTLFMTFVHVILGRYHPWRVRLLYPLYVLGALVWTIGWLWRESFAHDTVGLKLAGTLGLVLMLPLYASRMAIRYARTGSSTPRTRAENGSPAASPRARELR